MTENKTHSIDEIYANINYTQESGRYVKISAAPFETEFVSTCQTWSLPTTSYSL